jgi:hypothetical protein
VKAPDSVVSAFKGSRRIVLSHGICPECYDTHLPR